MNAIAYKLESRANIDTTSNELFDRFYSAEKDSFLTVDTAKDGKQSVIVNGAFAFDQDTELAQESAFIDALYDAIIKGQ